MCVGAVSKQKTREGGQSSSVKACFQVIPSCHAAICVSVLVSHSCCISCCFAPRTHLSCSIWLNHYKPIFILIIKLSYPGHEQWLQWLDTNITSALSPATPSCALGHPRENQQGWASNYQLDLFIRYADVSVVGCTNLCSDTARHTTLANQSWLVHLSQVWLFGPNNKSNTTSKHCKPLFMSSSLAKLATDNDWTINTV